MTVDSRPSDVNRSLWAASRWNLAMESVSVCERRGEQARVLIIPGAAVQRDFRVRSPVGSDIAHRIVTAASGRVIVRATR
jgi:hypothetical protein